MGGKGAPRSSRDSQNDRGSQVSLPPVSHTPVPAVSHTPSPIETTTPSPIEAPTTTPAMMTMVATMTTTPEHLRLSPPRLSLRPRPLHSLARSLSPLAADWSLPPAGSSHSPRPQSPSTSMSQQQPQPSSPSPASSVPLVAPIATHGFHSPLVDATLTQETPRDATATTTSTDNSPSEISDSPQSLYKPPLPPGTSPVHRTIAARLFNTARLRPTPARPGSVDIAILVTDTDLPSAARPNADRLTADSSASPASVNRSFFEIPESTQSLPAGSPQTAILASAVAAAQHAAALRDNASSSQSTITSDSDDDRSTASSVHCYRHRRKRRSIHRKMKPSALTLASPDSPSRLGHRLSSSNLSVVNIAASIQNYRQKRHGTKEFDQKSYMSVYGDSESFEIRRAFIADLTRSLGEYGAPSHRLEFHLEAVSQNLGINCQVFVMPGLILITFEKNGETATSFVKLIQGYNMSKLSQVNDLCFDLVHGSLTIERARECLKEIRDIKVPPAWTTLIIFPIFSFVLCIIGFGGTWIDASIAAVMSFPVAGLTLLSSYIPSMGYLIEFTSGLFVVIASKFVILALLPQEPCLSLQRTVFSGISMLLPGLALTTSIIEISTRNVVSGTVRLFSALFTAMLLGFGYTIGDSLTQRISVPLQPDPSCPAQPVNLLWALLLFPPMSICNCQLFRARKTQYPIMMLAQALGFTITTILSHTEAFRGNIEGTTATAAFAVGIISNLYSRITRDVAIAPILGGIILLVPGSFGLRSTLGFLNSDSGTGTAVSFQMLIIGICITIGLFLATLIVWPIRGPRTKYITV